ncbi:MAG: hypothetical protein WBH10_04365 [Allopontixanthobacter sediminis]
MSKAKGPCAAAEATGVQGVENEKATTQVKLDPVDEQMSLLFENATSSPLPRKAEDFARKVLARTKNIAFLGVSVRTGRWIEHPKFDADEG